MVLLVLAVKTVPKGTWIESVMLARFSGRVSGPITWALGNALCQSPRKMWCSMSGAVMYLTGPPRVVRVLVTSGVRATGEKTARAPEVSLTVLKD